MGSNGFTVVEMQVLKQDLYALTELVHSLEGKSQMLRAQGFDGYRELVGTEDQISVLKRILQKVKFSSHGKAA